MTSRLCILWLLLVLISLINPPAPLKALDNPANWSAEKHLKDPLAGKIWSTAKQGFITPETLAKDLAAARFILLGEIHDNPDHHKLQAAILNHLVKENRKPAIVMEMIRVDQMRRYEAYMQTPNPTPEALGTALLWQANGWPDWSIYLPIGKAIITHQLEVYPGLASRMLNNHLIKKNIFSLPKQHLTAFHLDQPLEADLQTALIKEVRTAHCDKLPDRVIKPMAEVQRFRDAFMADVMITAANDDPQKKRPVALIAGAGHTRTDRGAPWYLKERLDEIIGNSKILTIQFAEIQPATKDKQNLEAIKSLALLNPKGNIAADFVWITPRKNRGNYCDTIPDFGKKN